MNRIRAKWNRVPFSNPGISEFVPFSNTILITKSGTRKENKIEKKKDVMAEVSADCSGITDVQNSVCCSNPGSEYGFFSAAF